MRIIGGKLQGVHIDTANVPSVRPTTNRAKEALFNILANYYDFELLVVLDLFAGAGNVGFEFASRGCRAVVMVEKNRQVVRSLLRFVRRYQLDNVEVWLASAERFVKESADGYDIIFMDPPYQFRHYTSMILRILNGELLRPGGRLIVEHHHKWGGVDHPYFEQSRRYGQTVFSFFKRPLK